MEDKIINGFSLFNDVVDDDLRIRNRAIAMGNIVRMYNRGEEGISQEGNDTLVNYFSAVPYSERAAVYTKFILGLKDLGIFLVPIYEEKE